MPMHIARRKARAPKFVRLTLEPEHHARLKMMAARGGVSLTRLITKLALEHCRPIDVVTK